MSILDKVNSVDDLKQLNYDELRLLSDEIRSFLIDNISKTGGHIASNLGSVELILAINRVYNPDVDRIIYDVGHQSYTHKIINGRKDVFNTIRTYGGISGFPKPYENNADAFVTGHSSNSISIAYGMAKARSLQKSDYNICAVLGDGALTGGLAYEGLENVASSKEPILIILNDNAMSIDSNVGGMNRMLQRMRTSPDYFKFKRKYRAFFGLDSCFYLFSHKVKERLKKRLLKSNMFTDMGLEYLGPVDGHNVEELEKTIRWAKEMEKPVLLHVITVKGKGVKYTAEFPDKYHGVGPFDPITGKIKSSGKSFGNVFGSKLSEFASKDDRIVAVTAAMGSGTGLEVFSKKFPDRFFDVGIAEGHAVSMCGGMAKQGLLPVFAVYSSFLQRGYDMLIEDISLLNLHVVFGIDRSGIVGQDGETHNGVFDVAYLSSVPNMAILCPSSFKEIKDMLKVALYEYDGPVAIRYPRGSEGNYKDSFLETEKIIRTGDNVTIVTYGILINNVLEAAESLNAEVIKLGAIKPCSFSVTCQSLKKTKRLIVVEDVCESGCVGLQILASAEKNNIELADFKLINLGDGIVPHGKVNEIYKLKGLDKDGIIQASENLK